MKAAQFRQAGLGDIELMLDWAAAEGWNPGLDDASAFHAADPGGFFVAEVERLPVAAISVVNHSDSFAFLGLYICRAAFRGQGIGYALWNHALGHAGGRTVGLDGVAAQQANYEASGFVRTGASVRFEGRADRADGTGIREATAGDTDVIAALDRAANGFARPAFLAAWTRAMDSRRTLVMEDAGGVHGFATARRCHHGIKVGPVVARDAADALSLMRAASGHFREPQVIIDVPSGNVALIEGLRTLGFEETFATARMYRGAAPVTGDRLQAIGTMELG